MSGGCGAALKSNSFMRSPSCGAFSRTVGRRSGRLAPRSDGDSPGSSSERAFARSTPWSSFSIGPARCSPIPLRSPKLADPTAKSYPNGFAMQIETDGSIYNPLAAPVLSFGDGELSLANGGLSQSLCVTLSISSWNSSSNMALKIFSPTRTAPGSTA